MVHVAVFAWADLEWRALWLALFFKKMKKVIFLWSGFLGYVKHCLLTVTEGSHFWVKCEFYFYLNMLWDFIFFCLLFDFCICLCLHPPAWVFWKELDHLCIKHLSPKANCRLIMRCFVGTFLSGLLPTLPSLLVPSLICFTAEFAFYL